MQITIKTLDESRLSRVEVTFQRDETEAEQMYTASEVTERLGPDRTVLRLAGQEDRIAELELELARERSAREAADRARNEVARELTRRTQERDEREEARANLEKERDLFKARTYAEREHSDESRDRANRAEIAVTAYAKKLGRISRLVHDPNVGKALGRTYEAWEFVKMAEAIRQVRNVLSSPGSSEGDTSQA